MENKQDNFNTNFELKLLIENLFCIYNMLMPNGDLCNKKTLKAILYQSITMRNELGKVEPCNI